jgi:hypothetical protein
MQADTTTRAPSEILPPRRGGENRAVAVTTRSGIVLSEPARVLVQSMAVAAALWVFLLYFGLFMYAFLWSLTDARELYAFIMGTKAINWLITASVITGIVLCVRRLQDLQTFRAMAELHNHRSGAAFTPPEKGGVYGRARNAEDHEIDAALRGKTGGFAPMFEE